jgi:hypothetical protein
MSADVVNYTVDCVVMTRAGEIRVRGVRLMLDGQEIGHSDAEGNFPGMPRTLNQKTFKLTATYQNAAEHLKKEDLTITVGEIDPAAGVFDARVSNTINKILDVAGDWKITDTSDPNKENPRNLRTFSQEYNILMNSAQDDEVRYDRTEKRFSIRFKLATLSLNVPYFNQNESTETVSTIPGKSNEPPSARDVTPAFSGGILCFPTSVRMLLAYWEVHKVRRVIMQETYRLWAEKDFDGVVTSAKGPSLYGRRDQWKTTRSDTPPADPTPWQRWLDSDFKLQVHDPTQNKEWMPFPDEWNKNTKKWVPSPERWRVEKPVPKSPCLLRADWLFDVSAKDFQSELTTGPLTPKWRKVFEDKKIALSINPEPSVTLTVPNKRKEQWKIEDAGSQKNYMVFHQGIVLNVYGANVWGDFANELDDGKVSEALCQVFKHSGLTLTTQAVVDVAKPGEQWIVVESANSYLVWKDPKLQNPNPNVYEINWTKVWTLFEYERQAVDNFKPNGTRIQEVWFDEKKTRFGRLPGNILVPPYTKQMLTQLEQGYPMVASTTATDGHIMIIRGAVVDRTGVVKWLIVNDPYGTLAGPDSIYLELGGSVGKKSKNPKITVHNDPEDIKAVKLALTTAGIWRNPINENENCDGTDNDPLVKAIKSFETKLIPERKPSGTVEPGGVVLGAINARFSSYRGKNEGNKPGPLPNEGNEPGPLLTEPYQRGKHVYYNEQIHGVGGKLTIKGIDRGVVMLTRATRFNESELAARLTPGV